MNTKTTTYTISNIAGGDMRTFRTDGDGRPSDASIRHARRQGHTGYVCSDSEIDEQIAQAIADSEVES